MEWKRWTILHHIEYAREALPGVLTTAARAWHGIVTGLSTAFFLGCESAATLSVYASAVGGWPRTAAAEACPSLSASIVPSSSHPVSSRSYGCVRS